jgi:hypothetical protein
MADRWIVNKFHKHLFIIMHAYLSMLLQQASLKHHIPVSVFDQKPIFYFNQQ